MNDEIPTLIVIYPHGRVETFNANDADYWIRRRYEKQGLVPERVFIGTQFDFQPIIDAFDKEEAEHQVRGS